MKCVQCDKEKEDVEEVICPYAQDVYNEVVLVTLCDNCYTERLMDI